MTETSKGLLYARILLAQAVQNLESPVVASANINGFIALARSVTYFMQKEFNSVAGFQEWYEIKQAEMKNHSLFSFFHEIRNLSIHQRPQASSMKIETRFEGSFSAGGTYIIPMGRVNKRGGIDLDSSTPITRDGEPAEGVKGTTRKFYIFDERPDDDAVSLCEEHLKNLEPLVKECYDKFGKSLNEISRLGAQGDPA